MMMTMEEIEEKQREMIRECIEIKQGLTSGPRGRIEQSRAEQIENQNTLLSRFPHRPLLMIKGAGGARRGLFLFICYHYLPRNSIHPSISLSIHLRKTSTLALQREREREKQGAGIFSGTQICIGVFDE